MGLVLDKLQQPCEKVDWEDCFWVEKALGSVSLPQKIFQFIYSRTSENAIFANKMDAMLIIHLYAEEKGPSPLQLVLIEVWWLYTPIYKALISERDKNAENELNNTRYEIFSEGHEAKCWNFRGPCTQAPHWLWACFSDYQNKIWPT